MRPYFSPDLTLTKMIQDHWSHTRLEPTFRQFNSKVPSTSIPSPHNPSSLLVDHLLPLVFIDPLALIYACHQDFKF